ERVEQRGLASVRITHEGDHSQRHSLARIAPRGALAPHRFNGSLYLADSLANPPTIGFELLLAGSPRPNATAESRKFFAASGQSRQQIIQLREFDLKLPFARSSVSRENIQNKLRAVNYTAIGAFFHVAELHGRQIVIDNHQWNVPDLRFSPNLFQLAAPHERRGLK